MPDWFLHVASRERSAQRRCLSRRWAGVQSIYTNRWMGQPFCCPIETALFQWWVRYREWFRRLFPSASQSRSSNTLSKLQGLKWPTATLTEEMIFKRHQIKTKSRGFKPSAFLLGIIYTIVLWYVSILVQNSKQPEFFYGTEIALAMAKQNFF